MKPKLNLQNVEPAALEAIVEYVYTPESLVITEDNVQVSRTIDAYLLCRLTVYLP